jgi:hypothetical protein
MYYILGKKYLTIFIHKTLKLKNLEWNEMLDQ